MHRSHDDIPIDRLLLAVDAIFDALREMEWDALPARPAQLLGATDQPASFCEFTRDELQAASDFLERLGMLPLSGEARQDSGGLSG